MKSVKSLGWVKNRMPGRYLHKEQNKANKSIKTHMPRLGFQPTISVLQRVETVHTLDHSATVPLGEQTGPYAKFAVGP
jgi:hypothetical protein